MACNCLCCTPGACCIDGECSVETCVDCEAAGGTWQGPGTTCDDGDCADSCCYNSGACGYAICESGYFASRCAYLDGDPGFACGFSHPGTGQATCWPSAPASWTVTVAGAAPNNPSDPDDVALAAACNGSFVVDPASPCSTNGTYTDPTYGFTVSVTMFVGTTLPGRVNAGIDAGASFCANGQAALLAVVDTDCQGRDIFDCSGYALSAGNTGYSNAGRVDFSGATVALS